MRFEEVLPAFRAGKKIRRTGWPKRIYITTNEDDVCDIGEWDGAHANWTFPFADLWKDDWEIVDD